MRDLVLQVARAKQLMRVLVAFGLSAEVIFGGLADLMACMDSALRNFVRKENIFDLVW